MQFNKKGGRGGVYIPLLFSELRETRKTHFSDLRLRRPRKARARVGFPQPPVARICTIVQILAKFALGEQLLSSGRLSTQSWTVKTVCMPRKFTFYSDIFRRVDSRSYMHVQFECPCTVVSYARFGQTQI